MRNAWFSFFFKKKKEKVSPTILYAKAFPLSYFSIINCFCRFLLCVKRFLLLSLLLSLLLWTAFFFFFSTVTWDLSMWWWEVGGGGGTLCIKLLGRGLLIGCAGGFSLSQVVAALVLLPHAVDEQEDEEDGEQEADHAACDNSWERERERHKGEVSCQSGEWELKLQAAWKTELPLYGPTRGGSSISLWVAPPSSFSSMCSLYFRKLTGVELKLLMTLKPCCVLLQFCWISLHVDAGHSGAGAHLFQLDVLLPSFPKTIPLLQASITTTRWQ